MTNRRRTTFVTFATVAMIVLGSSAQAKAASSEPQSYLMFLRQLPAAEKSLAVVQTPGSVKTGLSLMRTLGSLQKAMNILKHDPVPGPRQLKQMATILNQEKSTYSKIQNNINALLTSLATLQSKYVALELKKEALLAAGKTTQARLVSVQEGQTFNVMNTVQTSIASERGAATPTR